jgi:ComF family protein
MATVLQSIMSMLFPITCVVCGKDLPADDRYRLCPDCFEALPLIKGMVCTTCGEPLPDGGQHCFACRCQPKHSFVSVRSAGEYRDPLRRLLHEFKFRNRDYLDRVLGRLLVYAVEKNGLAEPVDYIVPVPMHPLKQFVRGYNQAELLARRLSAYLGKPVLNALQRKRLTRRQYLLSRAERSVNLKDAFAVTNAIPLKNRRVILIDDICTTCATMEECSRSLKKAGALAVYGFTIARD